MDDKLKDFLVFVNGNRLIGTADVTLPEISYMSDTMSGAGIAGEVETPTVGLTQTMGITINFKNIIDEQFDLLNGAIQFEFRGSIQSYDVGASEIVEKELKVVTKCIPKKYGLGNLAKASSMGTNLEYECTYLKLSLDGNEKLEIDKFNYIFKVSGTDLLATTRKNLGL